jgi:hypothetical protein
MGTLTIVEQGSSGISMPEHTPNSLEDHSPQSVQNSITQLVDLAPVHDLAISNSGYHSGTEFLRPWNQGHPLRGPGQVFKYFFFVSFASPSSNVHDTEIPSLLNRAGTPNEPPSSPLSL